MKKTLIALMALTTLVTPLFTGGIEANAGTIQINDNIINYDTLNDDDAKALQTITDYINGANGSQGKKTTGWSEINGSWYRFNSDGIAQTGWFKETDGGWFYLQSDGSIKTGWMYEYASGNWYYFNTDGTMQTGYDIDGCLLSDTGAWTDSYLRYDAQGNSYHDFTDMLANFKAEMEDRNYFVVRDNNKIEYKVYADRIEDLKGNDVTDSVVVGTNNKIVRPV